MLVPMIKASLQVLPKTENAGGGHWTSRPVRSVVGRQRYRLLWERECGHSDRDMGSPIQCVQVMMGSVDRCVCRGLPTIVALRFTFGTQLHRQLIPHAAE